jgi:hypothetical protein
MVKENTLSPSNESQKTENNKKQKELLTALIKGLSALGILFITLVTEAIIINNYHKSEPPHIPDKNFITGTLLFLIYLLTGNSIALITLKNLKKLIEENKALLIFLTGLGTILITISIYIGISLYLDYKEYINKITPPLAIPLINYLSLLIIIALLQPTKNKTSS